MSERDDERAAAFSPRNPWFAASVGVTVVIVLSALVGSDLAAARAA
jgi:hypothetical protein